MHSLEKALDRALQDQTGDSWDEVDRLSRLAVAEKISTPQDIKRLVAFALHRNGFDMPRDAIEHGEWTDALLAGILDCMERSHASRAQFFAFPSIMHSINRDGRLIAVTEAWLGMLGYKSLEEVIGHKSVEFLTADSQEKAKIVLPEFWRVGHIIDCEYTMIRADGQPIKTVFDAVGIRGKDGNFSHSVCAIRKK